MASTNTLLYPTCGQKMSDGAEWWKDMHPECRGKEPSPEKGGRPSSEYPDEITLPEIAWIEKQLMSDEPQALCSVTSGGLRLCYIGDDFRTRKPRRMSDAVANLVLPGAKLGVNHRLGYQAVEGLLSSQVNRGGLLFELNIELDRLLTAKRQGALPHNDPGAFSPSAPGGGDWREISHRLRGLVVGLTRARPYFMSNGDPGSARNDLVFVQNVLKSSPPLGLPKDLASRAKDKAESPSGTAPVTGRYEVLDRLRRMADKIDLLQGVRPEGTFPACGSPQMLSDPATGLSVAEWRNKLSQELGRMKPFAGFDPQHPRVVAKLTAGQRDLKYALEDVYELMDWNNRQSGFAQPAGCEREAEIKLALMYAVKVAREQRLDTGDPAHDNLPTRFSSLNSLFGVQPKGAMRDQGAQVERLLEQTNHRILMYGVDFDEVRQKIDALPGQCHAFGVDGRRAHADAAAEQPKVAEAIKRAVDARNRLGARPQGSSSALDDLEAQLKVVQRMLVAPELTTLRRIQSTVPASVNVPPADAKACSLDADRRPLSLIAHLPGVVIDPAKLRAVRQHAGLLLDRLLAAERNRPKFEAALQAHVKKLGGWAALDDAAGQALSQRIRSARSDLHDAKRLAAEEQRQAKDRNYSYESTQALRDALMLYLRRAKPYQDAVQQALKVQ